MVGRKSIRNLTGPFLNREAFNPLNHGEGRYTAMVFCPLLKISLRNPYLKFLDLAKLFVAVAPITKKSLIKFYPLSEQFEIWV